MPRGAKVDARFQARLSQALDAAGITPTELASKVGVNLSTVRAWRAGSSTPTDASLREIARATGVSLSWLRHGLGSVDGYGARPDLQVIGPDGLLYAVDIRCFGAMSSSDAQAGTARFVSEYFGEALRDGRASVSIELDAADEDEESLD